MTLTVRVTVKKSWNQLEKRNSATFHKDIRHCLSFNISIFLRGERLCKPTITLAPRFNIFFWMFSFLQCIFLAFSIRELRGWGLELFLVVIAIYRLRILLEGRWRVYCREQRQAGGLMAPYPANCSIIWSNSPTNLIQPSYNRARNTQVFHGKLYFNWFT